MKVEITNYVWERVRKRINETERVGEGRLRKKDKGREKIEIGRVWMEEGKQKRGRERGRVIENVCVCG